MTDEEWRETFHRFDLRFERLDAKFDQLEKRMTAGFAVVNSRFEGLENRLAHKADTWVVTVGIAGLGLLLTIYKFFI
jgi:hypothetical protein